MKTSDHNRTFTDRDAWDAHWSEINDATELNPAQIYRHRLLTQLVQRFRKSSDTIIDFGSGQGDLIRMLAPTIKNCRVLGFELSVTGIAIARTKTPNAEFYAIDLQTDDPPYADIQGMGTLGVCSEVIEHLDHPHKFLVNVKKFMAPGSKLIITVPSGPMNAFERSIGHRQHFTQESITHLVQMAGLTVFATYRAGFPFFNLYKLIAKMRGEKAREDAGASANGRPSALLKIVFAVFRLLFKFNFRDSPLGWQLIVIAENLQ